MADSIWTPGGYQGFRPGLGNAQVSRGPAARSDEPIGPWRARVELVPLLGSTPELWDVCGYYWQGDDVRSFTHVKRGTEAAQQFYRRLVDALRNPGAELAELLGVGAVPEDRL
jgi:hypothetical protein